MLFSCDFVEPVSSENTIISKITIKNGQNFGFCIGKCYSEMVISGNKVEFIVKERVFEENGVSTKDYNYNDAIASTKISSINNVLDLNKFWGLKDIYGCPDCADGGSEWIEIINEKGDSKKVTFEYGKTVPGIENLIISLREERMALQTKYVTGK
ncbi:hypothetical protein EGI22_09585 [Lacihabitans sp. LS3-19]|nr:hypothetical protein [Lacihabitans sp. LS3-19]